MTTIYQQALNIVNTSPAEATITKPTHLSTFRKYLSVLASAKSKKFVTKVQGDKLIIKQYYEL